MSEPNKSSPESILNEIVADYLKANDAGAAPDRAALLGRHPDLRVELETFLEAQEKVEQWTKPLRELYATPSTVNDQVTVAGKQNTPAPAQGQVGFGDYELLAEIARGGMGVVYRARQKRLNRVVALKMILAGNLATATDVQRLRGEAEAAARLDHPHIVPIYEVNQHEGQHFFTMKLIEGDNLAQIQRTGPNFGRDPNGQRQTAALMAKVARAVHYAHQHGILHRDLKPANILLDDKGEPHVSDFGLAKRVSDDAEGATAAPALTQSGAIVGTPSYMAPEQAEGKKALTTAADTYSLGAILFELLTGQPPFRGETPLDTVLQVLERVAPSPRALNPSLAYDLETICLKCLEKDPVKRYPSAQALAEDLARWLADEPILGRRTSRWERTCKWTRRHPAVSALLGVSGTAAAALLVLAGFLWHNAEMRAEAVQDLGQARGDLALARQEHRAALTNVRHLQEKADEEKTNLEKLTQLAEAEKAKAKTARVEAGHVLYAADMQFAHSAWDASDMPRLDRLLANHRPGAGQEDMRSFEWHYLWRLMHRERFTLTEHGGKNRPAGPGVEIMQPVLVAMAPDDKTFASVGADKKIHIWDLASGRVLNTWEGPGQAAMLAYAADGNKLQMLLIKHSAKQVAPAFLSNILSGNATPSLKYLQDSLSVQTLDLNKPGPMQTEKFAPAQMASPASFLQTGPLFAALIFNGAVPMKEKGMLSPTALAPSRDGKTLAIGGFITSVATMSKQQDVRQEGAVLLWDLNKNEVKMILKRNQGMILAVAFGPDGTLASSGMDRTILLWKPNGEVSEALPSPRVPATALRFSPDGKRLFAGAMDGIVTVWNTATNRVEQQLRGRQEAIFDLALTSDGGQLVASSGEGLIKVWNLAAVKDAVDVPFDAEVRGLVFTAEGKTLLGVDHAGMFKTCDSTSGAEISRRLLQKGSALAMHAAIAPDGTTVAFVDGFKNVLSIRDAASAKELHTIAYKSFGSLPLFAPDGKMLACASWQPDKGSEVTLWSVATGKQLHKFGGTKDRVMGMAFSPDGNKLAVCNRDKKCHIWDTATGQLRYQLAKSEALRAVVFSRDGNLLALSGDTSLTLHQAADGKEALSFPTYTHNVANMVFSPDGKRLATGGGQDNGGRGGCVKIWDVATGRETLTLGESLARERVDHVSTLAFSADGKRLAAAFTGSTIFKFMNAGDKSVVRIWDAE